MSRLLRATIMVLATALAVLFGFGCVLAALFELQGFGAPNDQGPRPFYLVSLAVGFVLCVGAPLMVRSAMDRLEGWLRRRSA